MFGASIAKKKRFSPVTADFNVTSTFETDLGNVKVSRRAKYT